MIKAPTADRTKVCWSCDAARMENKGSYYQCQSCGATWCSIPKPGAPALDLPRQGWDGIPSGTPYGAGGEYTTPKD